MKAFVLAMGAIVVIAAAADYALDNLGRSSAATYSTDAVRLE
jgi:hypothetical protein